MHFIATIFWQACLTNLQFKLLQLQDFVTWFSLLLSHFRWFSAFWENQEIQDGWSKMAAVWKTWRIAEKPRDRISSWRHPSFTFERTLYPQNVIIIPLCFWNYRRKGRRRGGCNPLPIRPLVENNLVHGWECDNRSTDVYLPCIVSCLTLSLCLYITCNLFLISGLCTSLIVGFLRRIKRDKKNSNTKKQEGH